MNFNPGSFKFEDIIKNSEKNSSIIELSDEFKPKELSNKLLFIDAILKSNSKELDTTLKYLNLKNIVQIDSFKVFASSSPRSPFASKGSLPDDTNFVDFTICNDKGNFKEKISEVSHSVFSNQERKIKEFLVQHRDIISLSLKNFNETKNKIELEENFWTYGKILAYSINIWGTGNMVPISKISNVIFAIHKFIVEGFIFTIVVSLFYELVGKRYLRNS